MVWKRGKVCFVVLCMHGHSPGSKIIQPCRVSLCWPGIVVSKRHLRMNSSLQVLLRSSRCAGNPLWGHKSCAHHQGAGTAKPSPLPRGKYPKISPDVQEVDPTDTQKILEWSLPFSLTHFLQCTISEPFLTPHPVHQVKHEDYFSPQTT